MSIFDMAWFRPNPKTYSTEVSTPNTRNKSANRIFMYIQDTRRDIVQLMGRI